LRRLFSYSVLCDSSTEYELRADEKPFSYNPGEFKEHLEIFTQIDWVKNQSFCWKGQSEVSVQQMIDKEGLCFTMNYEDNLLIDDQ
jgi:hypothetical protein